MMPAALPIPSNRALEPAHRDSSQDQFGKVSEKEGRSVRRSLLALFLLFGVFWSPRAVWAESFSTTTSA